MKIDELKQNLDFYVDAIFQRGYDLGWESVIAQLNHFSDKEWNNGNKATAEVIRKVLKTIDPGDM
jgi:hypothetical protein